MSSQDYSHQPSCPSLSLHRNTSPRRQSIAETLLAWSTMLTTRAQAFCPRQPFLAVLFCSFSFISFWYGFPSCNVVIKQVMSTSVLPPPPLCFLLTCYLYMPLLIIFNYCFATHRLCCSSGTGLVRYNNALLPREKMFGLLHKVT